MGEGEHSRGAILFWMCLVVCLCAISNCVSAEQRASTNGPIAKPLTVRTNFSADAELTDGEIQEVLSLAKAGGIAKPQEIGTFYYLVSGGRGVLVKSVERVKGR